MKGLTRREMIASAGSALAATATGGVGLWLPRKSLAVGGPRPSRSVVALARRAGLLGEENRLDRKAVQEMLDRSVAVATGKKDPDSAWRNLFSEKDTIGLKVNTLGGAHLSPHPELIDAIATRLIACGIPKERIVVWDRFERELKRARLTAPTLSSGIRVLATDTEGVGYERMPEMSGSIGSCFSRILSQFCTAIINVGVLKDHDLSGTSIGMKNLFGVIHNPNKYHFHVHKDPYLADLCLHPHVLRKQRLTICDAFRAQCDGGPAHHAPGVWNYDGLLVSRDVVALDAVGSDILEARRKTEGLETLAALDREPLYLQVAEERGVGWADRSKIDLVEIA